VNPVTQKNVAAAAGVHPSSISLAFAGSPKIPAATRERILAAAKKLGYVRDPMLSALAEYRHAKRPASFRGVIGWLCHSTARYDWRTAPEYRQYFSGLQRKAAQLGYKVSVFDLADYRENSGRVMAVMRARDVRGVLICPQPVAGTSLALDFSGFAAVAMGYTVRTPTLNVISSHFFDSMEQIARQICARGYRRIGYAVPAEHNERLAGNYLAAYLLSQRRFPPEDRLEPYEAAPPTLGSFRRWLREQKPDALITVHYQVPGFLEELAVDVPRQLGVALVSVTERFREYAGIDEGCETIGGIAAEFVASLVEHGQFGLPAPARRLHVEGVWHEGKSLRPRVASDTALPGASGNASPK